jgi:integrase/recombinase XerD
MSGLSSTLDDYLALRRSLGFKLAEGEGVLGDFVSFLDRQGASHITTELALRWAVLPQGAQPAHWARRLCLVRHFAAHCGAIDPRTEVPPVGLLPYSYRRCPPYIYIDEEIERLIAAAHRLPSRRGLRSQTYSTLFGLLAVTGMRASEPVGLDREDVDLDRGLLTIRDAKFGKSRLVPLHRSTQSVLSLYAQRRDRTHPRPTTPSFFLSDLGRRLTYCSVSWTFVKLSHQIGLRGPSDHHGPRLHDLRHTFAVRTLLGWYRDGADVEQRLPQLATYLGHAHVSDTYWYLTATPELLQLAAGRLDGPDRGPHP